MSNIEIVGCIFFIIGIIFLGTRSRRTALNLADYIVSGRSLSFSSTVGAIVSTWIGAGCILGLSSEVFRSKSLEAFIAVPLSQLAGLIFIGIFAATKIRGYRCLTIADIAVFHYGKYAGMLFAAIMAILYVCIVAAQFRAMGSMVHHFTGYTPVMGALICALTVAIYVHRGGLWSLVSTDFIQVKSISLMCIISAFVVVFSREDLNLFSVFAKMGNTLLPPSFTGPVNAHAVYWGQWLIGISSGVLGQDTIQRILAAKSDQTAKRATFAAAVSIFLICIVSVLAGLAGLAVADKLPDLYDTQRIFPLLVETFGGRASYFVFNIGLIAAILSSADSMLLAGSSLLAKNIALEIVHVEKDNEVPLVQVCNILVIMLAFAVSCNFHNGYSLIVYSGSLMLVTCFVPFVAALFLPLPSRFVAFVSFASGLTTWASCFLYYLQYIPKENINEAIISSASCFGFFGSTLGYIMAFFFVKVRNLNTHYGAADETQPHEALQFVTKRL